MPKFTQVRADAFESIQINAGILLSLFDPTSGTYSKTNIIGTTTGGVSFNSNIETVDYGDDVDNVPANTFQLKRVTQFSPTLSGTFVTVDSPLAKKLVSASDDESSESGFHHITPRTLLSAADFSDIWLVGDYSDKNGVKSGGFIAIHVKHAFSTGGFQWQTTKNGKGQFSFEFTGHYDMDDIDDQPFEIYVKAGAAEPAWTPDTLEDKTATVNERISFVAKAYYADGTQVSGVTQQWQRYRANASRWEDIEGEVSSALWLDCTLQMDGWMYRCKITKDGVSAYTNAATLTVTAGA